MQKKFHILISFLKIAYISGFGSYLFFLKTVQVNSGENSGLNELIFAHKTKPVI